MKKFIIFILFSLCLLTSCGKTYKVCFVSDEGLSNTVEVKMGECVTKPSDPSKEGYVFNYWKLDTQEYDFSQSVEKDLTIIADYTKLHIVNFMVDDEIISTREVKDQETIDKELSLPIAPNKEGYEFVSWQVDGEDYDMSKVVTSDLDLCANYQKIKEEVKVIEVSGIQLDKTSLLLGRDSEIQLTCNVSPANADNKKITYTSTHPEVASVDSNGKVTGISKGTSTIIATSSNGKTSSCDVEVFVKAEIVTVLPSRSTVAYDGVNQTTFTVHVSPKDADYTTIGWNTTGNVGGQNGSYSFEVNGAFATLTARDNSKYDKSCGVYAYITNKDGSITNSETVTITAEDSLELTKKSDQGITFKYENGQYVAYCPNLSSLEIKANLNITASFNNKNYIIQEYYEDKEVWLTLENDHSHAEGFQMYLVTPGGQKATVVVTVNN